MANPYHDAAGRFCSKGEMQADIKRLAKSGDFKAYFQLRKEYDDIIKTENLTQEELFDEITDHKNRMVLKTDTAEDTELSYQLVKNTLGGRLGEFSDARNVEKLLGSHHLSPEARQDILANANEFGLRDAIERGYLDYGDYQEILKREDANTWKPLIAKDHRLGFHRKKELLATNSYGVAVLAIHNEKDFFQDKELTQKLRDDVDDSVLHPERYGQTSTSYGSGGAYDYYNPYSVPALAKSPYAEDHRTIIDHRDLNAGYPTAAMALARNSSLAPAEAAALIEREIGYHSDYATSVAHEIRTRMGYSKETQHLFKDINANKMRYTDISLDENKRQALKNEIEILKQHKDAQTFISPVSSQISYLYGRLNANDKDYKALQKEYKKARSIRNASSQDVRKANALEYRLKRASSHREMIATLDILKKNA